MIPKDKGRPESRQLLGAELDSAGLSQTAAMLPRGLRALFPDLAKATKDSPAPIAALIPPSTATGLSLLLLSLASRPSTPLVVVPRPTALPAALKGQGMPQAPQLVVLHVASLDRLPEIQCPVLLVGDPQKAAAPRVGDRKNVQWWEDVWPAAELAPDHNEEISYIDTHSYWYNETGTDVAKAMHVVSIGLSCSWGVWRGTRKLTTEHDGGRRGDPRHLPCGEAPEPQGHDRLEPEPEHPVRHGHRACRRSLWLQHQARRLA